MTRTKRSGRGPALPVEDDQLNQGLAVAILTKLGDSSEVAATGRAAVETAHHTPHHRQDRSCVAGGPGGVPGGPSFYRPRDLVRRLEEELDRLGTALDAVVPRR